jgi:hypothetical protein
VCRLFSPTLSLLQLQSLALMHSGAFPFPFPAGAQFGAPAAFPGAASLAQQLSAQQAAGFYGSPFGFPGALLPQHMALLQPPQAQPLLAPPPLPPQPPPPAEPSRVVTAPVAPPPAAAEPPAPDVAPAAADAPAVENGGGCRAEAALEGVPAAREPIEAAA